MYLEIVVKEEKRKKNANLFYKDKKMQTKVIEIIYRFFVAFSFLYWMLHWKLQSFFLFKPFYRHYFDVFMKISEQ